MSDLRTLIEINSNLLPLEVIVKYEINDIKFSEKILPFIKIFYLITKITKGDIHFVFVCNKKQQSNITK